MKGPVKILTTMMIPVTILLLLGLVLNAAARTEEVLISDSVRGPSGTSREGSLPQIVATTNYTNYLPLTIHNPGGCLPAPTLISPTNGANLDTLNPIFVRDYGNNPNATVARMEFAYDPAFTQIGGSIGSWPPSGVLEFRFIFYNLDPATTYYWRAWLECGDDIGPYSEVWQFTTGSGGVILPAPSLIAPANGSTTTSTVNFEWTEVTGADAYLLSIQYPQGGRTLISTSDTQFQASFLEGGKTYSWWVEARNDYAIGDASETWQFTTPIGVSKTIPENCLHGSLFIVQPDSQSDIITCTIISD